MTALSLNVTYHAARQVSDRKADPNVASKTPSQCLRLGQLHIFACPPNYRAARKALQAAISIAPGWGEPHHWLGYIFERQGKLKDALGAYECAVRLKAGPRSMFALGWLKRLLGHFDSAIASLRDGLAMNAHYAEAEARLVLAECYECTDQVEQAVEQWRVVAQLPPAYPSYEQATKVAEGNLQRYGRKVAQPPYRHAPFTTAPIPRPRSRRPDRTGVRPLQERTGT